MFFVFYIFLWPFRLGRSCDLMSLSKEKGKKKEEKGQLMKK